MPYTSAYFLVQCNNSRRFKFCGHVGIEEFLHISPRYDKCIVDAPYAKNSPHCSRPINRSYQAQVPVLLSELARVRIPSFEAGELLKKLSSCVVCGITGWHQNQANGIWKAWCGNLWNDYLRVNGLNPSLYHWVPPDMTRTSWERHLDDARAQQQGDSEEDDNSEHEDTSDTVFQETNGLFESGDSGDSPISPPTAPHSNIRLSVQNCRADQHRSSERPNTSYDATGRSRRPLAVYRDPQSNLGHAVDIILESPTVSENTSSDYTSRPASSASSNRRPLAPLSSNIPPSVNRYSTPDRNSQEHSIQGTSSSGVSRYQYGESSHVSGNSSDCPEAASQSSGSRISQPSSQGGDKGNEDDTEERSLLSFNSSEQGDRNDSESFETANLAAPQVEIATVVLEASNTGDQSSSNAITLQEDDFPTRMLSLLDIYDFDDFPTKMLSLFDVYDIDDFPTRMLSLFDIYDTDDLENANAPYIEPNVTPTDDLLAHYSQQYPLVQLKQLLKSMRKTTEPTSGWIYAYSRDSLPGFLKIGYTYHSVESRRRGMHPVDYRLKCWEDSCGYKPLLQFSVPIPCAAERIEGLVHQTLREYRRIEKNCEKCMQREGKTGVHKEWFSIDVTMARNIVDLWREFSDQIPYDGYGNLLDFWSEKVRTVKRRLRHGDSVWGWMMRMRLLINEQRRVELSNIQPLPS